MDAAVIGAVSALGGAVIGALGSYLGPALLQRRQQQRDDESSEQERTAQLLKLAADARLASALWLRHLEQVADDLGDGGRWSLNRYDKISAARERAFRGALVMMMYHRYYIYSGAIDWFTRPAHSVDRIFRAAIRADRSLTAEETSEVRGHLADLTRNRRKLDRELVRRLLAHVSDPSANSQGDPLSFGSQEAERDPEDATDAETSHADDVFGSDAERGG
ncbi:hypothetical protein [Streptomyces sp. NK08204]|uniref:hypothetical protein n=1 Tax=Streptomyces sp. NK08204 TaxID=2873260 RepID=UPI001CEDEBD2|nr:hypothetical protein [Streptomyces sp. NK08204]